MATTSLETPNQSYHSTGLKPPQSLPALACRILLATLVAWFASQLLNHWMMGEPLIPTTAIESVSQFEFVLLTFVSSFLIVAVMSYAATLSTLRGIALVQVLAITHFGVNCLLALVEAAVFLTDMSAREVGLGIFTGAIDSVIVAVCIAAAVGKARSLTGSTIPVAETDPTSAWEWTWKLALCSVAYVFLYIVAGLLIFPFVKEYYPDLDPESIDPLFLIALQFRRGVFYAICVVPLIRSMRASRVRIALTMAVMVPVVHGVAGLLVPNEHMAAAAWRYAHMVEIGWSNFVLGLLIGFLFSRGVSPLKGSAESSQR